MEGKVRDLRSALERLKKIEGQYIETDVEVDPMAELAGVYRYVGAGGTVKRPTKEGPAMVFNNVKGHKDARVAIGVLASRKRVAALLDCKTEELGKKLYHSVDNPIAPVEYQEMHHVSRLFIKWKIQTLICMIWYQHQPTHQMMQAHILHWVCAMQRTQTQEFMM